ncbi:MAG: hypothetical protein KDD76_06665, partial [Rickettsiales bacterium]|nr:hypothetical protein [Rickettsiales bacterium]
GISSLPNGEIGYAGGTSNHHNINIDVRLLDAGIYYRVSANSKGSGIQKAKMNEEEFDVARLSLDRVATHEALHFRYKYGQHYNVINETNKLLSAEPARNPLYLGEELIRVNNEWQRQYDYIYDNGWKKRSSGELLEQNNSESLGLGYQPQHVSASDLATFAPSLSVHDLSTRNREHG